MGNSLYGNVINPPKSFQNITGDKGSIQAENTNNTLIIKGDGDHIETSISNSKLTIKHVSQPSEAGNEKVRDNPIIIQGGATDVKVVGIDSLKIDNKGHITNASIIKNYEIRPVGKEDRQENGDIGEIFNYYTVNRATGQNSHAEGSHTDASGIASHAEGYYTTVSGDYSHTEGRETCVDGICSHAEGYATYICPLNELPVEGAHAEGGETWVYGSYGHAEGYGTQAVGIESHAEGDWSYAEGNYSHAEGGSSAVGEYAHSEGVNTSSDGKAAHAEGQNTIAGGIGSHSEGNGTYAGDVADHAEGQGTQAYGKYSHAEGLDCIVEGEAGHAEGYSNYVYCAYGHAEGNCSYSDNEGAHSEGEGTYVSGLYAHGEGATGAYGDYSHAEGYNTYSEGLGSHSGGGNNTSALGDYSFAHGDNVQTPNEKASAIAFGKYNDNINNSNKVFQFGWGDSNNRKDIMYLTESGELYAGEFINQNNKSLTNIDQDLQQSKEDLKFTYNYDAATQQLTFIQGTTSIGTISVPINAVVNDATMIEGTTKLKLTVNVLTEEGIVIPKELELDLGEIALDQALLGETNTIILYQEEENNLQKIKGKINQNSILGGKTGHLAEKTISAFNIEENAIENYSIKDKAISNSKLSTLEDTLGPAVNTNNIANHAITSIKLNNASGEEAVVTGVIRNKAVTTSKINDNAITTDKLAIKTDNTEAAVSTNTIQDGAITSNKLQSDINGINSAVSTNTVQNGAITREKLSVDLQTTIDGKMNKNNPVGNGSLSINRKANTNIGANSIAIGSGNTASGIVAAAIGIGNVTSDNYSINLGYYNNILSTGKCNATLGSANSISDSVGVDGTIYPTGSSVGLGYKNNVQASASVAIGYNNTVQQNEFNRGDGMIAIGYECLTEGYGGISEGYKTQSLGGYGAHSEGKGTIVKTPAGHVQGRYNIVDETGLYAHIVGNGQNDTVRSNAYTLDWAGNGWYAGTVETEAIILRSSTPGSNKKFAVTVDDNGIVSVNELEETTINAIEYVYDGGTVN